MSASTVTRPAASYSGSTHTSPRKASSSRAPVILDDQPDSPVLSSAAVEAMRADFDLEATSFLRSLAAQHEVRIRALERQFASALADVDDQVKRMSLDRFVNEFGADPDRALKGLTFGQLRPKPMIPGEQSIREQSVRKRKRVQPTSPRIPADDDIDVFFASSKKARSGAAASVPLTGLFSSAAKSSSSKGGAASLTRSASLRSKRSGMSPSTGRKPRLRLRPSTSSGGLYHVNPNLPPTPGPVPLATGEAAASTTTTARRPKRGESIVMRSMNGSPLGEFIASEDDGDENEEESDDEDEDNDGVEEEESEAEDDADDDEWDLLERNEASNIEHQSASKKQQRKAKAKIKSKNQAKTAKLARTGSGAAVKAQPPTAASFAVALPVGAPSYDALKAQWLNEMQTRLRKADVSDAERRKLEEVLLASISDL